MDFCLQRKGKDLFAFSDNLIFQYFNSFAKLYLQKESLGLNCFKFASQNAS